MIQFSTTISALSVSHAVCLCVCTAHVVATFKKQNTIELILYPIQNKCYLSKVQAIDLIGNGVPHTQSYWFSSICICTTISNMCFSKIPQEEGELKSPKSHSLVLKAVLLLSGPIISSPCFYFICGNSFLGSESVRSLSSHLWLCPNTDTGKGHILHTIHGYLITLSMKTNNLWLAW